MRDDVTYLILKRHWERIVRPVWDIWREAENTMQLDIRVLCTRLETLSYGVAVEEYRQ